MSSIPLFLVAAFFSALIWSCFFIVQPKTVATVTRLGRYVYTGHEGFNFKLPWPIETVDERLTLAIQVAGEEVRVKTQNNAYVDMPIEVFYEVNENMVYEAAYNIQSPRAAILQLAAKEVRSVATSYELDDLFKDKDQIEAAVREALLAFVTKNGFRITNVVVDAPNPPPEIQNASNDVLASLRAREAAVNKAEAIRIERVGEAKADAQALLERVDAFSKSRATIADGMVAAAAKMQSGIEGLTPPQIVAILEGVDSRDALISASKGAGTIIVTTSDIGTANAGSAAGTAALVRALNRDSGASSEG